MKHAIFLLLLVAAPALADSVYELRPDENISSLLNERLNIAVIYRNGLLSNILKHNGLTEESAKKLPVGATVKIPEDVLLSQQPVIEAPVETPEASHEVIAESPAEPAVPLNITKWFALGFKPALLTGEGKDSDTSFSMLLLKASAEAGVGTKTDKHEILFGLGGDYAYLQKDNAREGNNSLLLVESNLTYRHLLNTIGLGLHLNFGQRMIFSPKPDEKYKFLTPWLYGIGPTLAWNNFNVSYLIYPEQTVKSDVKTKMNQALIMMYELRNNDHGLRFSGSFYQNSTQEIDSQQLELGARYVWYF